MSAQDQTLNQYHELMQINALAHLLRSGRETGIFDELRGGQRTAEQLCESLSLAPEPTELLLDAFVAAGIIQKYAEDYALAPVVHLLCQYDQDLGDSRWQRLAELAKGKLKRGELGGRGYFERIAATQWIHTPAAIQAAEILNIGGEGEPVGPKILDLGCGSAVWSCAMAHRDPHATVTAIDFAAPLAAAASTVASINLQQRFLTIEADPVAVDHLATDYDIVLIAQRMFGLGQQSQQTLLNKAIAALRPESGRLVVIDLFRGPAKASLSESFEALKFQLETPGGAMKPLKEFETTLKQAGLSNIQFSFLAASQINLGLMVGVKASI